MLLVLTLSLCSALGQVLVHGAFLAVRPARPDHPGSHPTSPVHLLRGRDRRPVGPTPAALPALPRQQGVLCTYPQGVRRAWTSCDDGPSRPTDPPLSCFLVLARPTKWLNLARPLLAPCSQDIAQPLLFSEAVFTQTNVFPRNPQEEERPFLYFNSIENDSSNRLGHAVKHILVQNGSAQISSAILSYLPLLPNIKRISTLCWHLDLPLPEDVLDRPLTKPKPVDLTLDLARFATPSYALIFNHWFDFSELRKREALLRAACVLAYLVEESTDSFFTSFV